MTSRPCGPVQTFDDTKRHKVAPKAEAKGAAAPDVDISCSRVESREWGVVNGTGERSRGRGWQREVGSQPSGVYFSNMSVLPALSITCCVCTLSLALSLEPSSAGCQPRESQRETETERESECERDKASAHVRTSGTAVTISGISGWL